MSSTAKEFTYRGETFSYFCNIDIEPSDLPEFDNKTLLLRVDFADGPRVKLYASTCLDEVVDQVCFKEPEVYLLPRTASLTDKQYKAVRVILKFHSVPGWLRHFVASQLVVCC